MPARHRKHELAQALRAGRLVELNKKIEHYMFYTYVLKSLKDGKLYIGWTNDLKNRFSFHCAGKVKATQDRLPLEIIYYEACKDKTRAISREKYFKTGFGRKFLKNRI